MSGGLIETPIRLWQFLWSERPTEVYHNKAKEDEDAIQRLEEAKRCLEEEKEVLVDEIRKLKAEDAQLSNFLQEKYHNKAKEDEDVILGLEEAKRVLAKEKKALVNEIRKLKAEDARLISFLQEEHHNKAKEDEDAIRRLEEAKQGLEEEKKALADEIRKLKVENTRLSSFLQEEHRNKAKEDKDASQGLEEVKRVLEEEKKALVNEIRRLKIEDTRLSSFLQEKYHSKAKEDEDAIRRLEDAKRVLEEEKQALIDEVRKLKAEGTRLSSFLQEKYHNKSKEDGDAIRRLEGVKRVLEEEKKASADEIWKLKAENNGLSSSLQEANKENVKVQKTVMQEREGKEAAQRWLEREQKEATKSRAAYQQEIGTLKRQLDTETRKPRTELQRSQTKLVKLTALLETRSRELKGAQAFLTTADAHSGAEVIALVDALNVEIMQTCAFISESFDFTRNPEHVTEITKDCGGISEYMDPTMLHFLRTVQHSKDPLLVQIALQSVMVKLSRWIIRTWDYDMLQAEQPLAKIYNDIRASETQAVSGRWRALTRAHAQNMALQHQGDLHSTLVTRLIDTLVVTMVTAGCTESYDDTYHQLTQKFGKRVSNVVKMALRLNTIMGEEVLSADLWPINAATGDKFDRVKMEDFEGQDDQPAGKLVLCTTALGLYRSEKTTGDSAHFKNAILKRPQVALQSVADHRLELLEQEDSSF